MTPKEKAEELVKRYSCLHHGIEEDLLEKVVISDYAIESALIAVDEMIRICYDYHMASYYGEVKQEIEKL